jgi:hypothetical protein
MQSYRYQHQHSGGILTLQVEEACSSAMFTICHMVSVLRVNNFIITNLFNFEMTT